MRETPVLFGSDNHLLGVASQPSNGRQEGVACLMLNFGVTQRIGPHRINVKLARRLASQGVVSFRFDLSGVGDSGRSTTGLGFAQQAVADLKAAMDHVEAKHGIRQFVVFGLCSGCMHGYSLALADARVIGLLLFDGFVFPTRAWSLVRAWHRLRAIPHNPAVVDKTVRWVKRLGNVLRGREVDIFADGSPGPTHAEFEQAMEHLLARRVAVYFVYSGTLQSHDIQRAQLGRLRKARFQQHVRYDFMADVDHTVTSLAAQERLLSAACAWIRDVITGEARPNLHDTPGPTQRSHALAPATTSVAKRVPV